MTQNEQEIKAKADQAVEMFRKALGISKYTFVHNPIWKDRCNVCAIHMYEDRVNTYLSNVESIKLFEAIPLSFSRQSYIDQAILTELKSRV